MRTNFFICLGAIVVLGGFLRFWRLAEYPVALSVDEVSIGYSSFSILKTAHDEFGRFLPLAFRSTGDYKPPVLVYLMVPSIAIFGLNEFGVRFPIALSGSVALIFVGFLTYELFRNKLISLVTTLSVAISPWHIKFSRGSFEAVLASLLMIAGVWTFLLGIRHRGKLLWLSGVLMALAMWSYHAERVMVPLFVTALFVIFRKEVGKLRRAVLIMTIVTIVVLLPLAYLLTTLGGTARLSSVFIGRDNSIQSELHKTEENRNAIQKFFDNNALTVLNFWFKRYLNYWDLGFLFFKGMGLSGSGEPDVGLFYLVEIIPFLIGLAVLLLNRSGFDRQRKQVVVTWLLLGPLAASLANNDQHPLRSLTAIPAPQILVGIGVFCLWSRFNATTMLARRVVAVVSAGVMIVSLLYYLDLYYSHAPIRSSEYDGYGLKQASIYAIQHQNSYKEVVFDPTFGTLGPFTESLPHLYVLFYSRYDPWLYQRDPRHVEHGGSSSFANFTFRRIYWPTDRYLKDRLFIGSPWSLPKNDLSGFGQILQTIPFKNGVTGFIIVRTSK